MLGNLILEACNNPGTGALTPAGAPPGRQTFSGYFGAGVKCFYAVTDGSQTEEGWTVTGTTLARNVIWNTAGTTSPLNFIGACQVYCTLPAQRAVWADDANVMQGQGRRLANLGAALSAADAVRLDQTAWQRIGADVNMAGLAAAVLSLPAGYTKFVLEWSGLYVSSASAGVMYGGFSTSGPGGVDSGPHYTYGLSVRRLGAGEAFGSGTAGYLPLSTGQTGAQFTDGHMTFNVGSGRGRVTATTSNASDYTEVSGPFSYTQPYPNAIAIGIASATFTQGSVRLLGWKPL